MLEALNASLASQNCDDENLWKAHIYNQTDITVQTALLFKPRDQIVLLFIAWSNHITVYRVVKLCYCSQSFFFNQFSTKFQLKVTKHQILKKLLSILHPFFKLPQQKFVLKFSCQRITFNCPTPVFLFKLGDLVTYSIISFRVNN